MTARAQYTYKDFKDSIGFIDSGRIWQPVAATDPGPDGRAGTADDGGAITIFYDVDPGLAKLQQTNRQGRIAATRGSSSWRPGAQRKVSVSRSRTRGRATVGSYNNSFTSNAGTADLSYNGNFVNPNRALNAEGRTRRTSATS
jgi:hypothetical protein